ncbi:uncharacterized protein [Centruroides vittatus]|uniref:uncharacterized protein n=1 Tax=Centruroides vittatus TaxID=120091 RepID=UPI00350FCCCF
MLMEVITDGVREEAPWTMLYADDIVLCAETKEELRVKLERWLGTLEGRGLRVSRSKTVYMCSGEVDGARERDLELRGDVFRRVNTFKYLGSTVAEDGGVDKEVTGRIQAGWRNWRDMSGVLCDKRVPLRLKGKVYRVVVRPAMLYAIETGDCESYEHRSKDTGGKVEVVWSCGTKKRRVCGKKGYADVSEGEEEAGTTAETVDGSCGGGLEREASECGGSPRQGAVEATHQKQRPYIEWEKLRKKKKTEEIAYTLGSS